MKSYCYIIDCWHSVFKQRFSSYVSFKENKCKSFFCVCTVGVLINFVYLFSNCIVLLTVWHQTKLVLLNSHITLVLFSTSRILVIFTDEPIQSEYIFCKGIQIISCYYNILIINITLTKKLYSNFFTNIYSCIF